MNIVRYTFIFNFCSIEFVELGTSASTSTLLDRKTVSRNPRRLDALNSLLIIAADLLLPEEF